MIINKNIHGFPKKIPWKDINIVNEVTRVERTLGNKSLAFCSQMSVFGFIQLQIVVIANTKIRQKLKKKYVPIVF